MKKVYSLKNKKDADKRTALMGLAASKDVEEGACPSSEAMAQLVEGGVSDNERSLLLKHISSCESCYQEWLALNMEFKKREKKNELFYYKAAHFCRSHFKGLAGTALASAAAIAVFLTITHQPLLEKHADLVTTPYEVTLKKAPSPSPALQRPEGLSEETLKVSPPLSSESESIVPYSHIKKERRQKDLKSAERMTGAVGGLVAEPKEQASSSHDKMLFMAEKATKAPGKPLMKTWGGDSPFNDWLKKVHEGCMNERQEPSFWADLYETGKGLQAKRPKGSKTQEHTFELLSKKLMPLLKQQAAEPSSDRCDPILKLMDNAGFPKKYEK